jgi:hypothetical protein
METFDASQIEFVGEQDGHAERELKLVLKHTFLPFRTLMRAYLARVRYGRGDEPVALCLLANSDNEHEELVSQAQKAFRTLFKIDQAMDVLFLTAAQEKKLKICCRPFLTNRSE